MTKPTILLDKDFLQGSKADDIRRLAGSHQLLMSDVLFYELISSTEPGRSRCFAKLPKTLNPVTLVEHVGGLLKSEIVTRRACGKPSDHSLDIRFSFNADLASPGYRLPDYAAETVREQTEELRAYVASFLDRVRLIPRLIPNLLSGSDAKRKLSRESAEVFIATEIDEILKFYGRLEAPVGELPFPPAEIVTEGWALFRWQQVQLLFALDAYCRFNGSVPDVLFGKAYEKVEHDVLDAQYLILGTLEGAFATREKKLQRWFSLLCPTGRLVF